MHGASPYFQGFLTTPNNNYPDEIGIRQQPLLALGGIQAAFERFEPGSARSTYILSHQGRLSRPFIFTDCTLESASVGDVSSLYLKTGGVRSH
jgi:hypothetical protein